MSVDWGKPKKLTWHASQIDPATWEPYAEASGVTAFRLDRDATDDTPLLESATLESSRELPEGWYRVWAIAEQGGESELADIGTLLFSRDSGSWAEGEAHSMTGRSVLYPASRRKFSVGDYAPMGANGAEYAARLLRESTPAPVEVEEGGFSLSDHLVFDMGSTYLEGVWALLGAANWTIRIDGRGEIAICPMPGAATADITPARVFPSLSYTDASAEVPNVYIAIDGEATARAENADPESPTSTATRGRLDEEIDQSPIRVNGESLEAYCERKLTEARTAHVIAYDYTRDYIPDVVPNDLVRAVVPDAGIDAELRVMSQTVNCGADITVEETAGQEEAV